MEPIARKSDRYHDQVAKKEADDSRRGSLRDTVQLLSGLHGNSTGPLTALTVVGVAAGGLEAAALILFIRGALAITTDEVSDFSVLGVSIDSTPGVLLVTAAICVIATMGLHLALARGAAKLSLTILTNARTRLIDGFMNANWSFQATQREGALQEAASTLAARASGAATFLVLGGSSIAILVALLVSSILVSPLVSLSMIGVLIPVIAVLQPLTRATRRRSGEAVQRTTDFAVALSSTATLAREYRTFGVTQRRAEQLHALTNDASRQSIKTRTSNMLASFLFKDLALLAVICIVAVLHLLVDLRASATTAAVFLIIRSLGYAQLAYNVIQSSAEENAAITQLVHQIDALEAAAEPPGTVSISSIDRIEFTDVSFHYDADRHALENVNLRIERGAALGLVGPSGSGKTTIAELLLGLRMPSAGSITVDGQPLHDIRRSDWTRLVAFVPQDPRLSEQSIAENIRFSRDGISDDAIRDAARQAHIHDTIEALPDGYSTMLGARSTGLSGGQRQRLAIARALAGRPCVLVLDEPTSALDSASEELFRQTLTELRGTVTLVVIAHRPTTLDVCDCVVTVTEGRIASSQRRSPETKAESQ